MGEAKRKKAQGTAPEGARRAELQAIFDRLGIDYSKPGFYDDPAYIQHERTDPLFTETYAEWVLLRERTPKYDDMVRDVVPRLAAIINARLIWHNWNGGCIAITGILTRTLDRLGIWNIPMSGSASAYAGDESRHFNVIDDNEGVGFDTGHMWIISPPFDIVDLTLHYQRWQGDDFQRHIPKIVLSDTAGIVRARAQDVVAPAVRRRHGGDPELHFRLFRDQKRILKTFPARQVTSNSIDIRYVPAGIRVPLEQLEGINTDERQGVSASRIWEEDVKPAFALTS